MSSISASEESAEDDTGSANEKEKQSKKQLAELLPHVRELRSKLGRINRSKFEPADKASPVKSRRISSRKMDESESSNEYEENVFASRPRRNRSRHLQHTRNHLARTARRSALSLRPINRKSYADSHSSVFNTDSDGVGVRRSKRKRVQFRSSSWLADDQVHKIGYPSLDAAPFSEEDSRDAQNESARKVTRQIGTLRPRTLSSRRPILETPQYSEDSRDVGEIETEKCVTRHSIGVRRPNQKYFKFEEEPEVRPRRRPTGSRELQSLLNDTKENMMMRPKTSNSNGNAENEGSRSSTDKSLEKNGEVKTEVDDDKKKSSDSTKKSSNFTPLQDKDKNSESENEEIRTRSSSKPEINRRFPMRRNRTRKVSSSSESERERKSYSLRTRVPKPSPIINRRLDRRRRFSRRRRQVSSSSDSSDSEVGHKEKSRDKYNKLTKSPHSKLDQKIRSGVGGSKIVPIGPETLDNSVRFNSIGGLDMHIQCLKEMILLPMMYPEVFEQFQVQPPRGVLFHGPPGTGKTLIARALANECSFGNRKVSFFMRKGADLLSKWIGESEKQLHLLFEQAAEMKPSIIFFDELDGLAPVRSSRQDQIHASIVSTLLALMDGIDGRGDVIVIGATNRIDAIDPALRRPGRFDRELYFPLPTKKEREEILNVHISNWTNKPNADLLSYLAEQAIGYCGSDIRALCSEAVIQSFKRTYPQVYNSDHRLLLQPENVDVKKLDFMRAKSMLIPSSHRTNSCVRKKLLPILEPLLGDVLNSVFSKLAQIFPHGVNEALSKVKLSSNIKPAQMLFVADGANHGQTTHLAPALLFKMEHIQCYTLDLTTLYKESLRSPEEATLQVFTEARRNVPSSIYIPNIDNWWYLSSDATKAIFFSQLSSLDPNIPILILATSDCSYDNLPAELQKLFSKYRNEVYEITSPNEECRRSFFKPLIVDSSLKPQKNLRVAPKTPPPLPRAPTPPPPPKSKEELRKIYEEEERVLRELRIFLRDMCRKLANNKMFYIFTKPVDTEEVPDYTNIIKDPMDLETMMSKVDFHTYQCAKDFLTDIELICKNALEYNPARSSVDKQIRHRANSLRDYAYTLIKNEMDTDFEEKCQDIAKKRTERNVKAPSYLPDYIITPDNLSQIGLITQNNNPVKPPAVPVEETTSVNGVITPPAKVSPPRKRRCNSNWSKGHLKKRRKKVKAEENNAQNEEKISSGEDSKDNTSLAEVFQLSRDKNSMEEELSKSSTTTVSTRSKSPITSKTEESQVPSIETTPTKNNPSSSNVHESPKRRLDEILSPSDLLEETLECDDVEQALNEIDETETPKKPIQCSRPELELVLDEAVKVTEGCSLQALLDLYHELNKIIKKYLRTNVRNNLPQDLHSELNRFKEDN